MGKKAIDDHVKRLLASRTCNPKNSFQKYNEIGEGEYGKVYKACLTDKCLNKIAVKNSGDNLSAEYLVTKRLEKLGVPQVFGYERCPDRQFMYSEFISGVTLKDFLTKRKKMVTDDELRSIIVQVLMILYTIQQKYPSFRHHDIHLENIMVRRGLNVTLMDFGLATMDGVINPIIRSSTFKTEYGIYPRSDEAYDIHLFLSSLYATRSITQGARRFLERTFDPRYLQKESDVVKAFRLRHDVEHALPSIPKILKDPYLAPPKNTVKAFINALPAPKKNLVVVKKKSPVNQNKAKQKAMAVLKKMANAKKVPAPTKKPVVKKKPVLMRSPTKPLTK